MNLIDELIAANAKAERDAVIMNRKTFGLGPIRSYALAKDSKSVVVSKETPLDLWLENELNKIDPDRHEMGGAGEAGALRKLVFSLKERIEGGAK